MLNKYFIKELKLKEKNSEGYTFRIGLQNGSNGSLKLTNSDIPTIKEFCILQVHRQI